MIDRYANLQIGCLETKWRTGLKRVAAFSIFIRSLKENAKKLNKAKKKINNRLKFEGLGQHKRATTKILKTINQRHSITKILEDFHATVRKKTRKTLRA